MNYTARPCNLCGSRSIEPISTKDRNGDYLLTVICKSCGLIWSDPGLDEKGIKEFYSHQYRREYKGITRPKKKHVFRNAKEAIERYDFIKDIISDGSCVLDIGAGNGVFVCCLRKLGSDAKGIEPDENHARYASEHLKVPVATGFARDIKEHGSFDVVTLHHVLEHMVDPLTELKNIWNILKDDGFLVVDVPNAEDMMQDPKNRYHKAHLYTFNPETIGALGSKTGFAVFKKQTKPLNGNISVIFQKTTNLQDKAYDLSGNYDRIIKFLKTHNNLKHFMSPVPYKKLLRNTLSAVYEQLAVLNYHDDNEIIDKLIRSKLNLRSQGLDQTAG